jgi:hypothetical protein
MALAALGAGIVALPSCEWDGHFTVLGYTTRPNYDTRYKTVQVKIFKDPTFWAVVPVPGLEMELTKAIVREIEAKTPYKVVQCNADTELVGSIKSFTKAILNQNQMFEQREVETTLLAEVLWRDLKTGKILTAPTRGTLSPLPADALAAPPPLVPGAAAVAPVISPPTSPLSMPSDAGPVAEAAPPPTGVPTAAVPAVLPYSPFAYQLVRSVAYFRPELGESITSAQQRNVDRMAIQIISAMEKPW